jgi:hypothetical protein
MKKDHSPRHIRGFIKSLDNESLLRFLYCYQLGSTFVHLSKMERDVIHAMGMCDRIKVADILGDNDAKRWEKYTQKHRILEDSTLKIPRWGIS